MNQAVLGLGSNLEPELHIAQARTLIANQLKVIKESAFVRTKPMDNPHQPDFINGAILVETPLELAEFKALLKTFETQLGRKPSMISNTPRTMDIDLQVWNNEILDPYFYRWDFIRTTILEVLPDLPYDRQQVRGS